MRVSNSSSDTSAIPCDSVVILLLNPCGMKRFFRLGTSTWQRLEPMEQRHSHHKPIVSENKSSMTVILGSWYSAVLRWMTGHGWSRNEHDLKEGLG